MTLSGPMTNSFQPFECPSSVLELDKPDDDENPLQVSPEELRLFDDSASPSTALRSSHNTNRSHIHSNEKAIQRRRRDVRAARDKLSDQYEQLRKVLPEPPRGVELSAKAQVLDYTLRVLQSLMKRATELATELAIVSPEATRNYVRTVSNDGRKPIHETVTSVMKLFSTTYGWRYAEWWMLDEKENNNQEDTTQTNRIHQDTPAGVAEDPVNVHGCVVRDSISVMRLGCTVINRSVDFTFSLESKDHEDDEKLSKFARASRGFEFEPRIGMPGRIWTSRQAEWLVDLEDGESFVRSALADEFGLKACLAVPIQFGGHVHSVMAFYSREAREYQADCYELAVLLSECVQDVYSPTTGEPWQVSPEQLFPSGLNPYS